MLLVCVVRDRAAADVAVRVVAEGHESDAPGARLARGEVALGERQPVAAPAVEVFLRDLQAVGCGGPVEARLSVAAAPRRAGTALAPCDPAVPLGRSQVHDEIRGALERLPRDDHRFVAVFQRTSGYGLNIGEHP